MKSTDDMVRQPTDYIKKKLNREFTNRTHGIVRKTVGKLNEKRRIKVHRKNINEIQQFDNEINDYNINTNHKTNYKSNISQKTDNNIYKIKNLNKDRDNLIQQRQELFNENPELKSRLNHLDYSSSQNKQKKMQRNQSKNCQKSKQKIYNRKFRDKDNDGVPDRIDIDDTRNSVQTSSDLDEVRNRTQKNHNQKSMRKEQTENLHYSTEKGIEFDKEKIDSKNQKLSDLKDKKKRSKFQSPLTSKSVGERTKTQKIILAPTSAVSSIGASIKESINEDIEASDDEGIKFVNEVLSKSARSLKLGTNNLIAKKVGFDKKAHQLNKIENKILKKDKKAHKIKKAQRKNIRKKAKAQAKAVTGKKSALERAKEITTSTSSKIVELAKRTKDVVLKMAKMLYQKAVIYFGGSAVTIGMIALILLIPFALIGGGLAISSAAIEEENQQLDFSAIGLSSDVMQWESKVLEELEKYGLEKYKDLALVIINLESGGTLPDVMQSSESKGLAPNTITDPHESIEAGILHLSESIQYMNEYNVDIKTLIHSYNYGTSFIPYVSQKGGKWTQEIANDFSEYHANRLGWSNYGDTNYVTKALEFLEITGGDISLKADFDLEGGKLAYPVPGFESAVSSSYGWRIHPISGKRKFHTGTDIPAPTGTRVIAVADGVVTYSGNKGTYGKTVMIDHGSGVVTLYAHHSRLNISKGEKVKAGTTIAFVGSTGASTGPHSHFEVRKNGEYTDPVQWLNINK